MGREAGEVLKDLAKNEYPNEEAHSRHYSQFGDRPDAGGFDPGTTQHPSKKLQQRRHSYFNFTYDMNKEQRGCFVIFNQITFNENLQLRRREGGEADHSKLESMAKSLGFEHVQTFSDKTSTEIKKILHELSKADHATYDCFACAILSHGGEGDHIYARDGPMMLSNFTSPFEADECRTLGGKPKLFFIQACRGDNRDNGASVSVSVQSDAMTFDEDEESCSFLPDGSDEDKKVKMQTVMIPAQADFLIAHASSPKHYAFLNGTNGGWFIEALHRCFTQYGNTVELMQIMTKVNNMVASYRENGDGSMQIPSVASRLRSEVYFKEKTKYFQNIKSVNVGKETRSTQENRSWNVEPKRCSPHSRQEVVCSTVVADEY